MSWLLEESMYLVAVGLAGAAVCGWFWLQSGRRVLLHLAIGLLIGTVLGVVIEQWVVTEREEVTQTLHALAAAVERNDRAAVLSFIHPDAAAIRQRASAEMPIYTFDEVKIKQNLRVEFPEGSPRRAQAMFNVVVVGRGGGLENVRRVPRYVMVEFVEANGQWLVQNYEHDDPRTGFRTASPKP